MSTLALTVSIFFAITGFYCARVSFRQYKYFQQSLKFRYEVTSVSDEIIADAQAPEDAKRIAAVLRVMAVSPRTLRNLSRVASELKSGEQANLFDGIPSKYTHVLETAIKRLAVVAMLDDPEHAPGMSAVLEAKQKPRQREKQTEIVAIRSVVYARVAQIPSVQQARDLAHC